MAQKGEYYGGFKFIGASVRCVGTLVAYKGGGGAGGCSPPPVGRNEKSNFCDLVDQNLKFFARKANISIRIDKFSNKFRQNINFRDE